MSLKRISQPRSETTLPKRQRAPITVFHLNNDCLVEIFSYLDIADVLRAYESHEIFQEPATVRFAQGGIERIDPEFLEQLPKGLYNQMKMWKSIKLKLLSEITTTEILPHFINLEELILSEIDLQMVNPFQTHLPKNLKSLEIDRCSILPSILDTWLSTVERSLTTLRVVNRTNGKSNVLSPISKLQHLNCFVSDGLVGEYPEIVAKVLENNRNLTELTMVNEPNTIPQEIWQQIMQLKNIRRLSLCQEEFTGSIPLEARLFPNLVSLHTEFSNQSLVDVLNHLDCEKSLEFLALGGYNSIVDHTLVSTLKRFTNCKRLEIIQGHWNAERLRPFAELTQIKTLNLNCGTFETPEELYVLVRCMPNLRWLDLNGVLILQEVDVGEVSYEFTKACGALPWPLQFVFDIIDTGSY